MQRATVLGQALVAVVYLAGCGSGNDSKMVPAFEGVLPEAPPAAPDVPEGTAGDADLPAAADPEKPPATGAAGAEGVDPELGLDPNAPDEPQGGDTPPDVPSEALPPEILPGGEPRPAGNLSSGFFVSGGRLFDRNGRDFVMRGINHPVAWFQGNALEWMDEIATTGSNAVRLVWETTRGDPAIVRASIERAVELGMVPMVELHDITGGTDVNEPAQMAQYYVDEMLDILREFEPYLLVNIANEWGAFNTPDEDWVVAYRAAVAVLRDAGVNNTIVIDANDYGQRGSTIVQQGSAVLDVDPQRNILFSTHMYQSYENPQTILDVMRGAQEAGLALIVGEFGYQHGERNGQPIPVPYTVMVDEAARLGLGYLAWSWTGNGGGVEYLDLSEDGSATQLTGWGDDIINGQNGIRSTAQPASIFTAP
jgi:mannan endo-1,4-beta-mannosidase